MEKLANAVEKKKISANCICIKTSSLTKRALGEKIENRNNKGRPHLEFVTQVMEYMQCGTYYELKMKALNRRE